MYILVINPGSTSTKISVYKGNDEQFTTTIDHDINELDKFPTIASQFSFRKENILKYLLDNNFDIKTLSCVIGRGGVGLKPVKSGAYNVNDLMINRLKNEPLIEHASNLGAILAKDIADEINVPSYIYDSVATDELQDIARISGIPDIERTSAFHALNSRAMAIKVAQEKGKNFSDMNFVVAHLGGGISLCALEKGKAIDISSDDEGPFSPERSGVLPSGKLIDLCFSNKYTHKELKKLQRGKGGIRAYINKIDMREVTKMIDDGDKEAKLLVDAMIYQIAKSIGSLATTMYGKVDNIILTGGISYNNYIASEITKRVSFIADVCVCAGENEMQSLAEGAFRILKGLETSKDYID